MIQPPTAVVWRKASRSANTGNCVEFAERGQMTLVRDSKNPCGGQLAMGRRAWHDLLASARQG